jgi:hypothetical protein
VNAEQIKIAATACNDLGVGALLAGIVPLMTGQSHSLAWYVFASCSSAWLRLSWESWNDRPTALDRQRHRRGHHRRAARPASCLAQAPSPGRMIRKPPPRADEVIDTCWLPVIGLCITISVWLWLCLTRPAFL